TAVGEEDALAVGGIALRGVLRRRDRARAGAESGHGEGRHRDTLESFHQNSPQRGSVTTSTTAGPPAFTAAMARVSAGARSFGSVIGPSPWAPMPRATVA